MSVVFEPCQCEDVSLHGCFFDGESGDCLTQVIRTLSDLRTELRRLIRERRATRKDFCQVRMAIDLGMPRMLSGSTIPRCRGPHVHAPRREMVRECLQDDLELIAKIDNSSVGRLPRRPRLDGGIVRSVALAAVRERHVVTARRH